MPTKPLRKVILIGHKAFKVYSMDGQSDQVFSMTVVEYDSLGLKGAGPPRRPPLLEVGWNWKSAGKGWKFNTPSGDMEPGDVSDEWLKRGGSIHFFDIGGKEFVLHKGQYTITGSLPNITVVGDIRDTGQSRKTYRIASGVLEEF